MTNFIYRADQLLLSLPESHPYVKFEGRTEEDSQTLQSIREAAETLGVIQRFGITSRRMKRASSLIRMRLLLSDAAVQIIQSAVYGRLIDSALRPEQLPALCFPIYENMGGQVSQFQRFLCV